jgi:hypothetical protein
MIVAWLKEDVAKDFFVKEGVPIPNEQAQKILALRTQLVTQIIKESDSYLGDLGYIKVCQENADVFLFYIAPLETLVVVIKSDTYNEKSIVNAIQDKISAAIYH